MWSVSDTRRNNIVRVTFLAYRDWALDAVRKLSADSSIEIVDVVTSEEEYKKKVLNYEDGYVDCIILIGWSWIIRDDMLSRFLCVGMHPSDLPMYRGGSPIQHQIIEGLEKTNISLMTISADGVDVGAIWDKEEWDLSGRTMDVILSELSKSTERLIRRFIENKERLCPQKQDISQGSYYKRRKPKDSKVTWEQLSGMSLRDVYNLIRALGDPYPNIYVEDEHGNILRFKEVEYIEKP